MRNIFKSFPRKRFIIRLIIAVLSGVLLGSVFLIFKRDLRRDFNDLFPPAKVEQLNLTTEEKLEDFEFFYKTVTESMPTLEELKKVYGVDIEGNKEYYKSIIENTTSDYEFYCAMNAICGQIPSFHTDVVYPGHYEWLNCYNGYDVKENRDVISHGKYWKDLLLEEGEYEYDFYAFSYVDGKYLYNPNISCECEIPDYSQLVTVDGVPVDKFVIDELSVFNFIYDWKNNKPHRVRMVFNNYEGKPVQVEVLTQNGKTMVKKLYYSIYAENNYITRYFYSSDADEEEEKASNVYNFYEDEKYAYIAINSMSNSYGNEIMEKIKGFDQNNIILDLRKNTGGIAYYAGKYIYPYIADEAWQIVENKWYMPDSDANKVVDRNSYNFSSAKDSPYNEKYNIPILETIVSATYEGQLDETKNVVILTSHNTGSAADRFVSDMKKLGIATIVGNNTGGEGLMGSFCAMEMPNSKLIFVYMPSGAKNPDGSDNSAIGTKADVYSSLSVEDFIAYYEAADSGKKISDYEQKLKYDTVLKTAINLFS